MDESQTPEISSTSQKTSLKEQFTTVTPLSKFLAMVLFVAFPFVGFWFGMKYQTQDTLELMQRQTNIGTTNDASGVLPTDTSVSGQLTGNIQSNQEIEKVTQEENELLLNRIRSEYSDIFSTPTDYSFEWRWYDTNTGPNISNIQGKVISTSEFSFQDLFLGDQSLFYQIENTLPSFFEQEGFTQATANDSDHPTNGSSVQGYERINDGVVCLRIIEDTESEFMNYKIACGFNPATMSPKRISYDTGQYLDWVGNVVEYIQDCGGGEKCFSSLRISLPENMQTSEIFEARINIEQCVDETLRTGDNVHTKGHIQTIVSDIGLIFSCDDSGTSVTRK